MSTEPARSHDPDGLVHEITSYYRGRIPSSNALDQSFVFPHPDDDIGAKLHVTPYDRDRLCLYDSDSSTRVTWIGVRGEWVLSIWADRLDHDLKPDRLWRFDSDASKESWPRHLRFGEMSFGRSSDQPLSTYSLYGSVFLSCDHDRHELKRWNMGPNLKYLDTFDELLDIPLGWIRRMLRSDF